MKKSIQFLTKEYLIEAQKMKKEEIIVFLDGYREMISQTQKDSSILISLKVPRSLLGTFKAKARLSNVPYQSQIKILMKNWINNNSME